MMDAEILKEESVSLTNTLLKKAKELHEEIVVKIKKEGDSVM